MVFTVGPLLAILLILLAVRAFKKYKGKLSLTSSSNTVQRTQKFCPVCQLANTNDANFCKKCGNEVEVRTVFVEVRTATPLKNFLIGILVIVLAVLGFMLIKHHGESQSGAGEDYGNDGGTSLIACDYVGEALKNHDPRYFKMATETEARNYKENMSIAADTFRQAASEEGSDYFAQLSGYASQMSNGMKGIAEDGTYPVLDFCGY